MIDRNVRRSPGRVALTNGRVVTPTAVMPASAIIIQDGLIMNILDGGPSPADVDVMDVAGRYIVPGLVDIHTHGALGTSFNEPTHESFDRITRNAIRHGVTAMVATLMSAPISDLRTCLDFISQWMQEHRHDAAQVVGVHLEGPYLSPGQPGVNNPSHFRHLDDGSADILLEHHRAIRIVTFAPELPGGPQFAGRLARLGIVPAAGHSQARDDDILAAMQMGLRHAAHIWSGQSTLVREGPWRRPGLLEATLTLDDLTSEMISDGRHLPPTLMKLAYKCLGPDRLAVITDATSGAGLPPGSRYRIGEVECEIRDNVGVTVDGTSFAGSTRPMNEMLRVLTENVGIPLVDVIRMATLTPAHIIGADSNKGSLEVGKDADIVVFDNNFAVWGVMIGGHWAYGPDA